MSNGGLALRKPDPGGRIALLTQREWVLALLIGLLAGSLGWYFSHISQWIPGGFALAGVAICHMVVACRFSLPLPQTAILISCIYYVFAPIANIYYPTTNPLYRITDPEAYFAFAIPCIWATACGWSFAFYRARPIEINESVLKAHPSLFTGLDYLIICGMAITFALPILRLPGSLATLAMLAANMRYVGVFGWAIMARPGWKWRLLFVLAIDLYQSVSTGFFLNFLLWMVNATVVIMFRHRFSTGKILLGIALIVLMLPCFQYAKWELRKASWGVQSDQQQLDVFGTTYTLNPFNKAPLLFAKVVESSFVLIMGRQSDSFIADTALRYNQGWIVSRIQKQVPFAEPYADGETVNDAVVASLVPRFMLPNKLESGGGATFTRFTGVVLNSTTSMNLGFVGEMYANYGYSLGILACGGYGLFFGIIFQRLITKARTQLMMLSFIPYVLNFAVVSEVGLVDVLNYTIKSLIVAAVIYAGAPAVFARINFYRENLPNSRIRRYSR